MSTAEITWSLMHPTVLDPDYMARVVKEASGRHVDSFEICAACHTLLGGLEGLVTYDDIPEVASTIDCEAIRKNIGTLKKVLAIAHESGRPVYYWHREVMVYPAVLKLHPELLDKNGEFDLLGEAYGKFLRYKLTKAIEAVPELDGIVLTLTEADFSAIHNSTPDVYPPAKVVERIVRIFAEEHVKRGKRLIVRSFGSIAKDYEDILAGCKLASADFAFEVETKITPYDFDPFLPDNPFLVRLPNLTLGAECDSLGEFLGAGYLPAENVANIVRFVRHAQKMGVDRYTIRLDRVGNNIFDKYPVNLYAYEQAILHPELTAEDIRKAYADAKEPAACRDELIQLGKDGFTLVEKVNYIDHNVIFHSFPPQVDLKWLKAGGIFAVFQDNADLSMHTGIWSILSSQKTPGRRAILAEKAAALALAKKDLALVESLKAKLPDAEYERLHSLWSNAVLAAMGIGEFVKVVCAYYDGMEAGDTEGQGIAAAVASMEIALGVRMEARKKVDFNNGMDHHVFRVGTKDPVDVYIKPLIGCAKLLLDEYAAEVAARKDAAALPGVYDYVIPGAITDENRCGRFMHASHAALKDGRPGRLVGNQVFPNGFVRIVFRGSDTPTTLRLAGEGTCKVDVNGTETVADLASNPVIQCPAADSYTVVFRKAAGVNYPRVTCAAFCK